VDLDVFCKCCPKHFLFLEECSEIWYIYIKSSYTLAIICVRFQSNNILIYPKRCNVIQFILSGNCSTCFGWYLHSSSGAQTTVSTASGICYTVIAADSSNGVTNTRCCRYSCFFASDDYLFIYYQHAPLPYISNTTFLTSSLH
jgi:hypothetical protein